jgi:hypothetical protein
VGFGKLSNRLDNANNEKPASSVLDNCLVMIGFSSVFLKVFAALSGSTALADVLYW